MKREATRAKRTSARPLIVRRLYLHRAIGELTYRSREIIINILARELINIDREITISPGRVVAECTAMYHRYQPNRI